LIKASLYFKP